MKNNNIIICKFNCEFLCHSEMINLVDELYSSDSVRLITKLKKDLHDLNDLIVSLNDCLDRCKKEINFIENFLDDCGVDVYEA